MADCLPTYSRAERDRRWSLARAVVAAEGLDALLVYGGPVGTDTYFTNDRPGSVVLFAGVADPVQLVRSTVDDIDRCGDDLWLRPDQIRVGDDPAPLLTEFGTVGVVGVHPAQLAERLPRTRFRSAWIPLLRAMLPNSAEELALVDQVARIGDAIAAAMRDAARPGVAENDVLTAGLDEGYLRGAQPRIHISTGSVACGRSGWSHRPHGPRVLADGDVVLAEVRNALALKETRSQVAIAIGEVHRDIEAAVAIARACYDTGLALLRPGRTFGEVAQVMEKTVREAGGWTARPMVRSLNPCGLVGGFGRGTGDFTGQVYGGEVRTVGADVALRPGMTFAVVPHCVLGGWMASLGGTVVVGADAPIELNALTAQLLRA